MMMHGKAFDTTKFWMENPGECDVLKEFGGYDAYKKFDKKNHFLELIHDIIKYYIIEYWLKAKTIKSKIKKSRIIKKMKIFRW